MPVLTGICFTKVDQIILDLIFHSHYNIQIPKSHAIKHDELFYLTVKVLRQCWQLL